MSGWIAVSEGGEIVGTGPTSASAIADARQRGHRHGRARRATAEEMTAACRDLPPRPAPEAEVGAGLRPAPTTETAPAAAPGAAYFAAVREGRWRDAERLLAAGAGGRGERSAGRSSHDAGVHPPASTPNNDTHDRTA